MGATRRIAVAAAVVLAAGTAAFAAGGGIRGGAVADVVADRVAETPPVRVPGGTHTFAVTAKGTFDQAWAMAFLPDTPYALITEKPGRLKLRHMTTGGVATVAGVPSVVVGGQGGFGDVIPGPDYDGVGDRTVFLSWVEAGAGDTRGAVVGRATLDLARPTAPRLTGLSVIWRQQPKTTGYGHYSHRLATSPDGRYLYVTSGDRQRKTPAQDPASDLGKIIRIDLAADVPSNAAERLTLGHRNPLGIEFAPDGRLWASEMGPQGGDELNLIRPGANYGWPLASNGRNYGASYDDIPDHTPGDGFDAPAVWWNPSISPGSLMIYRGDAFPNWYGDAFLGGLSGQALIRVDLEGAAATKAEQWPMGARIRVVEEAPDGTIWLIEDGNGGRLLHLTPTS